MNRFITADKIHDGLQFLASNTVIEIDTEQVIVALHEATSITANQKVEYLEGLLCPGFVNAHCHLELSHTKGTIEEGTRLVPFLKQVMMGRNAEGVDKDTAIANALDELVATGCVAVGDIANTTDVQKYRTEQPLHFYTFIEALGFDGSKAEANFDRVINVYNEYQKQPTINRLGYRLRQSIVPHAPYSVHADLFKLIDMHQTGNLVSIHNEETAAENEYFQFKTGEMKDLYQVIRFDENNFTASGKTSLQTYLSWIANKRPILLVHNTFMNQEDIYYIRDHNYDVYTCLCPNANWYIERQLPNIEWLASQDVTICLGTDSLASNYQLNIYEEIKTIQQHFPTLPLEQLLTWATWNGAKALQLSDIIGKIAVGYQPGIVQINHQKSKRIL